MKTKISHGARRPRTQLVSLLLATSALSTVPSAFAQDEAKPEKKPAIEKVTVTATKRSEVLQKVPVSVQVLSTKNIDDLNIQDVNDYSLYLPNVTIQPTSPGFVGVYMRGVASGENRNHSGPSPSVGIYVDETPITTIQGALDVRVYDVARIEALAGPQGTLYGANSQAGTIRIITNKPDPSGFSASYRAEVNAVDHGGIGASLEGHVNAPLSDDSAIRIVGWAQHDAGYIDNKRGERLYPFSNILDNNYDVAKDNYNDVDTYGMRAALRIDLDENWTMTPSIMAQDQKANGVFFYDPQVGDLAVTHWFPEDQHDKWALGALTIEGKFNNMDFTYAGSLLGRHIDGHLDYADYGFFYDKILNYGNYFIGEDGTTPINPAQRIESHGKYLKQSHELRLASSPDLRLRWLFGAFYQRQVHDIYERYIIDGLFNDYEVPTLDDTIWLTSQKRIDTDKAIFGELTYDLTEHLSWTGGLRLFKSENSLTGFFGFGDGFSSQTGVSQCFQAKPVTKDAPCTNLNKDVEERGATYKLNLTYSFDDDKLVYATYSTGYRPGGINRKGSLPPYQSDYLTNYEFGWKTILLDDSLRFNGAFFYEVWSDFQFSFLGTSGLTQIQNAGRATIKGIEADFAWAFTENFTLSGGATLLTTEFNGGPGFPPDTGELPVTPEFKGNLVGRYTFDFFGANGFAQGAVIYSADAGIDLRQVESAIIGRLPSYTLVDLSTGFDIGSWTVEFYVKNAFDERAIVARSTECQIATQPSQVPPEVPLCGAQPYDTPTQPRTFAIRVGQTF